MSEESGSEFTIPQSPEVARQSIIDANIGTLLDAFPRIDPTRPRTSEYPPRVGIRGGDRETYDGASEEFTRIIYETASGKIVEPPKDFWKPLDTLPDDAYPYRAGDYSILDTWLRDEGESHLLRLHLSANRIAPHAIGHAVEAHTAVQEGAMDRLDAVERRHAELYKSGDLILPRRLIPGAKYNEGLFHEPWGTTSRETFGAMPDAFVGSIDPKGDLVMRDTINKFNKTYGPDWIKELPEL